jgi:hypothetical protein
MLILSQFFDEVLGAEGRGRRAEGEGREAQGVKDSGQRSEVGGRGRTEIGSRRSEVGGQPKKHGARSKEQGVGVNMFFKISSGGLLFVLALSKNGASCTLNLEP